MNIYWRVGAVLTEVLTASFEVEKLASYPGAGMKAGVQSTALTLLLNSWSLAALLAEGELVMTVKSSGVLTLMTGVTCEVLTLLLQRFGCSSVLGGQAWWV